MLTKDFVKKRLLDVNKLMHQEVFAGRDLTAGSTLWLEAKGKYDAALYEEADAILERIVSILYSPDGSASRQYATPQAAGYDSNAGLNGFVNNISPVFDNMLILLLNTLTRPWIAFNSIVSYVPVPETVLFLLIFCLLTLVVSMRSLFSLSPWFILLYPLFVVVFIAIDSALLHFMATILKGKGTLKAMLAINSFCLLPFLVFSLLSIALGLVGVVSSILWMILYALTALAALIAFLLLQYVGVAVAYGLPKVKAALTVLFPLGTFIAIALLAILIFSVMGMVMWQLGIFNLGGATMTSTGFAKIKPQLAGTSLKADGEFNGVFTNGVGTTIIITNVALTNKVLNTSVLGITSTPSVEAGDNFMITAQRVAPAGARVGDVYGLDVDIGYTASIGDVTTTHTEHGSLRGPYE